MQRIFDWTQTNVHSTMNVCWGAMAALYHFHGVPKHQRSEKSIRIYSQKILKPSSPYLNGFSDDFSIPISRWAEIKPADLTDHSDLTLLSRSDEQEVCIVEDHDIGASTCSIISNTIPDPSRTNTFVTSKPTFDQAPV